MPVQDEQKGDLQAQHSTMRRGPDKSMYSRSQMEDISFEGLEDGNTSLVLTASILRPYGVATEHGDRQDRLCLLEIDQC